MRPETLRRRVEALRQRREDSEPLGPVPVIIAEMGESPADARRRHGVPDDVALCVVVTPVDMSVPRQ